MDINKIFILIVIFIVIIAVFGYKAYSTNLQSDKEKEVIQTQLIKEKEILDLKAQQQQKESEEKTILLNDCISKAKHNLIKLGEVMDYWSPEELTKLKAGKNIEIQDMQNKIDYHMSSGRCKDLRLEENCLKLLIDIQNRLTDSFEKEKEECNKLYK